MQAVPASQTVLPRPPHLRLGWAIAVAAVAIAIAAFALSGGNPRPTAPPWAADQPNKNPDQFVGANPDTHQPPVHSPTDGVVVVGTAADLAEALANPKTTKVHLEARTFDLTTLPEGVAFAGKKLELIGPPSGVAKIVAFVAQHPANGRLPGSLSIKADAVTLRGVRFEFHDPVFHGELFAIEGNLAHPVGIAIQAAQVHLIDCAFACKDSSENEPIAVAVLPPAPDAPPVEVRIDRCAFGRGKDTSRDGIAVQVPARAEVAVEDSGFGPHVAAIQVVGPKDEGTEPQPAGAPAIVKLFRSSFMLDPKCAAVAAAAPVNVTAGYCVFSPVGMVTATPPADPFGSVLHVTGKVEGAKVTGIAGQKNGYYRVTPVADKDAVTLAQQPWSEADPLVVLAEDEPWRAFRLKLTDPAVFTPGDRTRVIGAQFHGTLGFRAYPELIAFPPPPKELFVANPRAIVWYPEGKDDPLSNTFTELAAVLRAAQPGSEILIRHDGPLAFETTVELKPRGGATEFRVTFKPFPGSKPILTSAGGPALDQTLFRLMSGEVAFEGLQFLLKPSRPRDQIVAAVSIIGGKVCAFTNCVITLAEEDDSKAAAVLVADPSKVMAMDGALRPTPDVKFEKCLIRGKGRGVWVPVSRAVKIEAGHTLTAIDGPLFLAEPAGKASVGARSYLKLNRVTALVGGPLVELRAGKTGEMMRTGGLVPLDVDADECLFAAVPGAGQPLVEFDGIDPADAKTVLAWQVRKANRYANFDDKSAVAIVRPGAEGSTAKEWDWNQWIAFAGEPPAAGKPVGKVMFEKGPTGLTTLVAIKPADAVVKDVEFPDLTDPKPTDAGADAKALPVPWDSPE